MQHADLRRARVGRAAAGRGRGSARSGEAQVRRKREREIQETWRILIPIIHRGAADMEMKSGPNNYKWFVVAMLWFVCFFNYADRQAIFSVFDPIKGEMQLS